MKKIIVLLLCLAINAFSAEKEMKNKLIIHLKKPVIKLPDAKSEFALNVIEVSDASLKKTLGDLDIQTIRRTVPSFKLENHKKANQNNKYFQISDLSGIILKLVEI